MVSWQVDADAEAEEALIQNGSAVTQEDYAGHAERRQNEKKAMKNDYAQQYAKKKLPERLEEQHQRRIFSDLQQQDNRQKLRRPFYSRSYAPVPMGLPLTSEEWIAESEKWHGE
jgi:aldehyde:ferredoxin oxidoreductase